MDTERRGKLQSIQILRALAAWAVVGHHVVQFNPVLSQGSRLSAYFATYGALGVDLFFIISGFVIHVSTATRDMTPSAFWRRRIERIVPAYWFFTIVVALMLVLDKALVPFTQLNLSFLVKSLFFIPAYNPSGVGMFPLLTVGWTLSFEMMFYLIYGVSLLFTKSIRMPFVFIAVILLNIVGKWLSALNVDSGFIFFGNEVIFEFLVGVLLAIAYQRNWLQRISTPLAVSIASCGAWLIAEHDPSRAHSLMKVGLPFAMIVAALLSKDRFFLRFRLMSRLGEISYSTYLCHVIVLSVGLCMSRAWNISPLELIPFMVAGIVFLSLYSFRYVEGWKIARPSYSHADVTS